MTRARSTYLTLLAVLLSPIGANATLISYDISVSGGWFDSGGTPFGMPLSPNLTGTIEVDNSLVGIAALSSFSLFTGSMEWTLSHFVGARASDIIFDGLGNLTRFDLEAFEDGAGGFMYIYSNNTMQVSESSAGVVFNACNSCVSFAKSAVSVAEPGTLALLGLGILGMGAVRRRRKV